MGDIAQPCIFPNNLNFKDRVIEIVKKIPYGRVTTYGTVAGLAYLPRGARFVGGVLHFNAGKFQLPWHRVINKKGFISTICIDHTKQEQKALLESEGVEVSKDFMVNLDKYRWPSGASAQEDKFGKL